jgi:hypothetical protein
MVKTWLRGPNFCQVLQVQKVSKISSNKHKTMAMSRTSIVIGSKILRLMAAIKLACNLVGLKMLQLVKNTRSFR